MTLTNKKIRDLKTGISLQDLRNEKINMACLKGAVIESSDLREAMFTHVNLVNSKWEHIYFSNVHVNMIQLGGTIFENIIRPEAKTSELEEEPGTAGWVNVEPVQFKNSDLSNAIFDSCNLTNVEIKDCQIEGLSIDGIPIDELLKVYHENKA